MNQSPIILLLSGGLDSVCLLYDLKQQGCNIHALLFDYGQKHRKEMQYGEKHADALGVARSRIELYPIKGLFNRSALTDGKGGNIVPNRNSVFVHIAASIAISAGAESVVIGCNKDDQEAFPDCTWDWLEATNAVLKAAKVGVEVCAPYIGFTKWQIVRRAKELGVDLDSVWYCYKGGVKPCGKCGACKKMEAACA
jgi:7-cyano-7-deazaguanine synthase